MQNTRVMELQQLNTARIIRNKRFCEMFISPFYFQPLSSIFTKASLYMKNVGCVFVVTGGKVLARDWKVWLFGLEVLAETG